MSFLSCALLGARAADEPVRGPFWSGTVMMSKDKPAAMKGLAVTLGSDRQAHLVYDLDTMRVAAAWTGEFLEFGNTLTKIEWPPPPSVKGSVVFSLGNRPGWEPAGLDTADPRVGRQVPLPRSWAHHEAVHVHGDRVVLKYSVGKAVVLETPGSDSVMTSSTAAGSSTPSASSPYRTT